MKFFVTLTYPTCTDDTDAMLERIDELGRPYHSAYWDKHAGTTALTTYVRADSPEEALTTAFMELASLTQLIGVRPDAFEVLSERAHIERLGGPEKLREVRERFMQS